MSDRSRAMRLADWAVSHPRTLVAVLTAMIAVSVWALPRVQVQSGADAYLDPNLSHRQWTDEVVAQFGSEELVLIVYRADDLFSSRTLKAVRSLGSALEGLRVTGDGAEELAPVEDVASLASVKDLEEGELAFETLPLVEDPVPEAPEALARVRARAFANPLIRDNLLSKDGKAAAMAVRLVPGLNDEARERTVEHIRSAWSAAVKEGSVTGFHMTGNPVLFTEITRYVQADTARFIPLGNAVMFALMLLLLRRLPGALLVTVNILACTLMATAVLPVLGHSMTSVSSVLSPLVMVLSAATMMHFLSELGQNARHASGLELVRETLGELLVPVTLCAFTTAVGFASLMSSDIPAISNFGLEAAVLVGTTLVFSLGTATLAARWRPAAFWISGKSLVTSAAFERWVDRYCGFVHRRPGVLVAGAAAVLLLSAGGLTRLVVDEDMMSAFDEETPTRQSLEAVEESFGGTATVILSLRSSADGAFTEPAVLARLEGLERFLRTELEVDAVGSLLDQIKLMHQSFYGGDPAYHGLPDSREQVAQLLLLGSGEVLEKWVDPTRQWVRMVARFREHSTKGQLEKLRRVDAYLREHFPASEGFRVVATGEDRLHAESTERLSSSLIQSMLWAFFPIFIPIMVMLRSVRAGLFSVPSNLIPIVAIIGLMGWSGISLNANTSLLGSIALGIVVDDTVHFLQSIQARLRAHGDMALALRETLLKKGGAVITSTIVFGLGFAVVMLSRFGPVREFGMLTAFALVLGMLAELCLLPPLLVLTGTRLGVPDAQAVAQPAVAAA